MTRKHPRHPLNKRIRSPKPTTQEALEQLAEMERELKRMTAEEEAFLANPTVQDELIRTQLRDGIRRSQEQHEFLRFAAAIVEKLQ